jgi:DNA-binding GntR family transcriptional regulator
LRAQIVDRLRDDILAGRFQEGERVSELQLVKRFGVSRAPIREALVQLTHEGLLVSKPNCGVRVAPAAPNAIQELVLPIRKTIETYALKLFFDEIGPADFQAWEDILARLKAACAAGDHAAAVELDIAFHRSILERAGQADLLAIWATLVARLRSYFRTRHEVDYPNLLDLYEEHRAIVDAFRGKHREKAVAALAGNIE